MLYLLWYYFDVLIDVFRDGEGDMEGGKINWKCIFFY